MIENYTEEMKFEELEEAEELGDGAFVAGVIVGAAATGAAIALT